MTADVKIRPFVPDDRAACAAIFDRLSDWFGIPETNQRYLAQLGELTSFVAERKDRVVGFTSLRLHNPESAELEVLAVDSSLHRQGIGRQLVDRLEAELRARGGIRLFHVRTLGPSDPYEPYRRTREFYRALGFVPLFESVELWGPENPALVLVKPMDGGKSATKRSAKILPRGRV